MIWENDVRVIVMLTRLVEGYGFSSVKCSQYWPAGPVGSKKRFGDLEVQLFDVQVNSNSILTRSELRCYLLPQLKGDSRLHCTQVRSEPCERRERGGAPERQRGRSGRRRRGRRAVLCRGEHARDRPGAVHGVAGQGGPGRGKRPTPADRGDEGARREVQLEGEGPVAGALQRRSWPHGYVKNTRFFIICACTVCGFQKK